MAWHVGTIAIGEPKPGFVGSDNFNRPDSTTTINPASDGNLWIPYSGTFGINSNKGGGTASAGSIAPFTTHANGPGGVISGYYLGPGDCGSAVQTMQLDYFDGSEAASFVPYLNFDSSTGSAYLLFVHGHGTTTVYRASSWSSYSAIGTVTLAPWGGPGSVLGNGITRFKVHSDGAGSFTVWQDVGAGLVNKGTVTDTGTPLTGTEGLIYLGANLGAGIAIDNFTFAPS